MPFVLLSPLLFSLVATLRHNSRQGGGDSGDFSTTGKDEHSTSQDSSSPPYGQEMGGGKGEEEGRQAKGVGGDVVKDYTVRALLRECVRGLAALCEDEEGRRVCNCLGAGRAVDGALSRLAQEDPRAAQCLREWREAVSS